MCRSIVDVRKRRRHVTRLQRQKYLCRLASKRLFDCGDEIEQRHRPIVADVINAVWRELGAGIGPLRGPRWIGCRDSVGDTQYAFDDIVDICEVARVLAVVEHLDRLARENFPRE